MNQKFVIPGILSLIACGWLYMAMSTYGIWDEGPLGGFMPALAAIVTIAFSIVSVIKDTGGEKKYYPTVVIPVVLVAVVILVIPLTGFLPSIFVLLLGWLRGLEKYSWLFSLITAVCVITCVWLIFSLWLRVPFPTGWLFARFA